jgi:hypothetical protein
MGQRHVEQERRVRHRVVIKHSDLPGRAAVGGVFLIHRPIHDPLLARNTCPLHPIYRLHAHW